MESKLKSLCPSDATPCSALPDADKYADPSGPRRMIGCSQERVEEQLRIALDGHPESELWGENGLIAATMRAANATSSALSGKLVGFDCREKTLTFAMDEMRTTGTLGETGLIYLPNVKEHATLSARASVDHGVEVETTGKHVNRAADRGCCVSSCSTLQFLLGARKSSEHLKDKPNN